MGTLIVITNVVLFYLGIPSAVRNINYHSKTDTSVQIQWSPPLRSGTNDLAVFYDVDCFKCKSIDNCEDACGADTTHRPSKSNIIHTNVSAQKLHPYTQYMFVIYSKNANSHRINRSMWAFAEMKVKTDGKIV